MTEQPRAEDARQHGSIPDGAEIALVLQSGASQKDRDFAALFRHQHKNAPAVGWDILADLFDFHFTPKDAGQPFRPMLIVDIEGFMDEQARVHRHFTVHAILAPAIRVMRDEHVIDDDAIELVIKDSALVPENHLSLFVKGVRAGFQFDFSTALHLLVPQVENGLRHVLEQSGVVPRNIDADGVEDVWLLGRILDHEKLREILDEDMFYELRTLMAGRLGPNLRNSIAHGLLNEAALNGEMGFYLWWVIVRLICLPTKGLAAFVERRHNAE